MQLQPKLRSRRCEPRPPLRGVAVMANQLNARRSAVPDVVPLSGNANSAWSRHSLKRRKT
jgi:hypothetical protein